MNSLEVYNKDGMELRTISTDGEPWFIAKDVCEGLNIRDVSQAVGRLDEDETMISKLYVSSKMRDVLLINESGLYNLILTSTKPAAKVMKKWVTSEVLPSIRKTGSYSTDEIKPMSELDMVITIATELKGVKEVQKAIRTSQELLGNEILSIKEERKKDADFRQEVLNQRHVGIMDNPPPPGYKGMPSIEKLSRLTKPIIEHIISRLNNIGTSQCYMYIDNANGFRDYTAYHYDTYRRAEAVFISECTAETKTLYSHHTYKKGRFQIAQEN